jgi:cell division cycle 2-like
MSRVSEGTYGIVWKARNATTNEIVALKQIKFDKDNDDDSYEEDESAQEVGFPVNALREINVLMAMSHACIVSVKEMVVGDTVDKVFVLMEYMELDLQTAIEQRNKIIADEMDDGIDIDHRTQPLQPSERKSYHPTNFIWNTSSSPLH